MGASSRRKGKVGELEVAQVLREAIPGLDAKRSYHQARGGEEAPDVACGLPLWLEVKRQKRPNIGAAIAQAVKERGGRPVWAAAFTRADRGPWLVTMTAEDWCDLVREWWEARR
jgi:hypothetical protein